MAGVGDIVNSVLGVAGGIAPRRKADPELSGRRDYVQIGDGDAAYDTVAEVIALITGTAHADFFKIWQLTVPAQQLRAWGYGSPALQRNQGYMYFASVDEGTDFDVGVLRIMQSKAREYGGKIVAELPDDTLHTTDSTTLVKARPTDINEMIPLPEKVEFPFIGEDSLMYLTYSLRTAATTHDNAGFRIPITVYE